MNDIGHKDVYPLLNTGEQQCLFQEIPTLLLKIIHRPCCEQFHVGTNFCLYHHAGESVVDDRPVNYAN